MALIVEDGTGKTDANTYLALADCSAYHALRGNTAWTGTDAEKEAALVRATQFLDERYRMRFKGARSSRTQALEWPRDGAYDQNMYYVDDVPIEVKNATAEAALRALTEDLSPDLERDSFALREKVGPIETEYSAGAPARKVYAKISDVLAGILEGPGLKVTR